MQSGARWRVSRRRCRSPDLVTGSCDPRRDKEPPNYLTQDKEKYHGQDDTASAQDHRPRDARVQARRTQERPSGKGGKVKSRRQAIAIALKEAGASKSESRKENAGNRRKYERKQAGGKTSQQEREGKSRVGARGRRESSRAMGGKNATRTTARGRKAAASRRRPAAARKRSTSKRGPRK